MTAEQIQPVMTADEIVGEKVLVQLHRKRLRKNSLAEVLGVSSVSVGRKISAESTFTMDELFAVARFLDVPITELLPGNDYDPRPAMAEGRSRRVRHQGLEPRTRWFGASPADAPVIALPERQRLAPVLPLRRAV